MGARLFVASLIVRYIQSLVLLHILVSFVFTNSLMHDQDFFSLLSQSASDHALIDPVAGYLTIFFLNTVSDQLPSKYVLFTPPATYLP